MTYAHLLNLHHIGVYRPLIIDYIRPNKSNCVNTEKLRMATDFIAKSYSQCYVRYKSKVRLCIETKLQAVLDIIRACTVLSVLHNVSCLNAICSVSEETNANLSRKLLLNYWYQCNATCKRC